MKGRPIPSRFRLSSYDYELPEDRIAQVPAPERAASRLMVLGRRSGTIVHRVFLDLPELLRPGDVLVINDTRVYKARLLGRKATGGRVELLVLRYDGQLMTAMFGANRGLLPGQVVSVLDASGEDTGVCCRVVDVQAGGVATLWADVDVQGLLAQHGHVPLPPYIRREPMDSRGAQDIERYQTVYARAEGAVAAPTAGLHFTRELLSRLAAGGVEVASLTLHVGPGTFRPIKTEDVRLHNVGDEYFEVPAETARLVSQAKAEGRRIVAVGTTSVRTLEAAWRAGQVRPGSGVTGLFIAPGHRFKVVDAMITNFHLPKSSLLVLVSAFAGRRNILKAHQEAIRAGYRFYSYGDAMLIA